MKEDAVTDNFAKLADEFELFGELRIKIEYPDGFLH